MAWENLDLASAIVSRLVERIDVPSDRDDDDDDDGVDAPASRVDNCVAGGVGTVPPSSTAGRLAIPAGEVYCAECHSMGAASVLAGYFDKVDFERSHFSCNRAYVTALLKKHMTENPDGNVVDSTDDEDGGSTAISRRRLKNMPRSELWYAHELHRLATTSSLRSTTAGRNDDGDGKMEAERGDPCDDDGPDDVEGEAYEKDRDESSAEFLVGKSVTLYNNLDNEYDVGRIVDWRACTVYPRPLTFPGLATRDRNGSIRVDINHGGCGGGGGGGGIRIEDLQYYGMGPLFTCEFLVRFPPGLLGRRKGLLRWIMLEEHSLAVGISLIQGKTSKPKGGGGGGGMWKPATILARSALELVAIRPLLCEVERGNLFGTMGREKNTGGEGTKEESIANGDKKWALASFFGESQHALLHLPDEAHGLLERERTENVVKVTTSMSMTGEKGAVDEISPNSARGTVSNSRVGEVGGNGELDERSPGEYTQQSKEEENDVPSSLRGPLASVDVPLALALAEQSERERCKAWSRLILHRSDHPLALLSYDEYSVQLHLEKGGLPVMDGSRASKSDPDETSSITKRNVRVDRAGVGSHVARSTNGKIFWFG